jgi:uncharacterized damage-inducible protein DinB
MSDFARLLAYDAWANRTAAAAVRAGGAPAAALRVLGHVVGAERLWLARLSGTAAPLAVWPALSVAECEAECAALPEAWRAFVGAADPGRLTETIAYVNSRGERWRSTVADVLMHVIVHSAYHRGQIASQLRAAGAEPAYTDFIHATRTGLIP